VVGGGILGLAVARELLARRAAATVCVLEREDALAAHQTGHSSGVIHAGIYYAPGSLKARLSVEGAQAMYDYCERRDIPHARCGKVILAVAPSERPRLDELERRGRANGVAGLRRLDSAQLAQLEPHARAIDALHSPHTGVVDFGLVADALARDVREAGGEIATRCAVKAVEVRGRRLRLAIGQGAVEAGHALFCAGAWADRLAVAAGAPADPRIVPFRGAYLRLRPERRHLVRALIYPVPDPSLPFLGVHISRHIDGEVTVGPTALLAPARDAYALTRARPRDLLETLTWPGTWRMARRWWTTALGELRLAASRAAVARAAQRFVPGIEPADLQPAHAGVRAQALSRDGRLLDDFLFSYTPRALHVRNAPSPGASAALAIARHVADEATRSFDLPRAHTEPRLP
jgi:2-hydroxyglutarate dehydrogenase